MFTTWRHTTDEPGEAFNSNGLFFSKYRAVVVENRDPEMKLAVWVWIPDIMAVDPERKPPGAEPEDMAAIDYVHAIKAYPMNNPIGGRNDVFWSKPMNQITHKYQISADLEPQFGNPNIKRSTQSQSNTSISSVSGISSSSTSSSGLEGEASIGINNSNSSSTGAQATSQNNVFPDITFAGTTYIPPVGTWVWVEFENGSPNHCMYGNAVDMSQMLAPPENCLGGEYERKWLLMRSPEHRTAIISDDPYDCRVELTGKKRKSAIYDNLTSYYHNVYDIVGNQKTMLIDDREGHDKILLADNRGNYINIMTRDGKLHIHSIGDISHYAEGNTFLSSQGDCHVKAVGNINLHSEKIVSIVADEAINMVAPKINVYGEEELNLTANEIKTSSIEDTKMTVGGTYNLLTRDNANVRTVDGDVVISTPKNKDILLSAEGNIFLGGYNGIELRTRVADPANNIIAGDIRIASGGYLDIASINELNIICDKDDIYLDGNAIHLDPTTSFAGLTGSNFIGQTGTSGDEVYNVTPAQPAKIKPFLSPIAVGATMTGDRNDSVKDSYATGVGPNSGGPINSYLGAQGTPSFDGDNEYKWGGDSGTSGEEPSGWIMYTPYGEIEFDTLSAAALKAFPEKPSKPVASEIAHEFKKELIKISNAGLPKDVYEGVQDTVTNAITNITGGLL